MFAALERHRPFRRRRRVARQLPEHRRKIPRSRAEKLVDDGVGDSRACLLVRDDHGREALHELLLDLAREHRAAAVRVADRLELLVVVHEKVEPLPGNVHVQIPTLLPVLLHREPPAGEGVLVHLVLDLLRGIGDVDRGAGIGRRHLTALTLERGKKSRFDQRGLVTADARRRVARHAKVRILVDRARDQAPQRLLVGPEEVREAVGKRGRRLRGRESDLPNVRFTREAEDPARRVEGDALGDLQHVEVERRAHVVDVAEDERTTRVEPARDDVFRVFPRQSPGIFELERFPQKLFVVGELDHERHLERFLQPLGEVERDEVTEVERLGGWSASGVQIELLALLVRGDDLVEFAMGEEHASAEEGMRAASRGLLDALDEGVVDGGASEVVDELGVVDLAVGAARDVPRRHHLLAAGVGRILRDRDRRDARGDLVDWGGHLDLRASCVTHERCRGPCYRFGSAAGKRKSSPRWCYEGRAALSMKNPQQT